MRYGHIFDTLFLFDSTSYTPPYVAPSVTQINGLEYFLGSGPSAASATFSISARGLVPAAGNITVTPSTNFEVFDGTTWKTTAFTIAYTDGRINTTSIYKVRLKAGLSVAVYSEAITFAAANAPTFSMPVNGEVMAIPTIVVSTPSLPDFANTVIGEFSVAQSYTVSGSTLQDVIIITAPPGFIINLDGSQVDASPITLTPSVHTVPPTTIYVLFNPLLPDEYAGNITHTSTNATTQNVAVTGNGTVTRTEKNYNYYHYI